MSQKVFRTVSGDVSVDEAGLVLPHEHLFTDLRMSVNHDYTNLSPDEVSRVMLPYLREAENAGVDLIVECSTLGVGRNLTVLEALDHQSKMTFIAPTGLYREEYIPLSFRKQSLEYLSQLWTKEILVGIEGGNQRAGFIKVAVSDAEITHLERKNLRAAAKTSTQTGAVIASHTIGGPHAWESYQILAAEGLHGDRFIWVHADSEKDLTFHERLASKGVFIEFDSIGQPTTDHESLAERVLHLIEAGFENHILLSHDAGWYQPGRPGGQPENGIRGYTALINHFIPLLKTQGASQNMIQQLTIKNPKRAFGIPV
jgi:phosphotriesterase-related protein